MFNDKSIKVREGIAWVVLQICTHHSDVMSGSPEATAYFINIIVKSLQDLPKISVYSCQAIEQFAKSVGVDDYECPLKNNVLTPHFQDIANALVINSGRFDDDDGTNHLISVTYSSLITLCQYCGLDSYQSLDLLLTHVLQKLEETVSQSVGQTVETLQSSLCGLV